MLTEIHISHLATIESCHIELKNGTSVMTGETGAGKSILIDAIELALGSRATGDMIRLGHDKADISLRFTVTYIQDAIHWLSEHELTTDHPECLIRRTIHRDGRSRCFVNGIPVTLNLLRELSDYLINIHGQHEHQALFKQTTQRDMLDQFAGNAVLLKKVATLSENWHKLSHELSSLKKMAYESNARSDFIKFQLTELTDLQLSENEFDSLDAEHKQLAHGGELLENVNYTLQKISDDESGNANSILNECIDALDSIQHLHPNLGNWLETLRNCSIQLGDMESELRHFLENMEIDPERLRWAEERISTLFNMARKHKITPQELYQLQKKFEAELLLIDSSDEKVLALIQQLKTVESDYGQAAAKLTAARQKAAKKLSEEITETIKELALTQGKFQIVLEPEEPHAFSAYGAEKILFKIAMNIGQTLQPLAKVASGGELSRIGLAIHVATAEQHTIPTLIFDEVDVGISGSTAEIVGKLLRRLGKNHQLLCITHLPQVAAQGHQHLLVEKHHKKSASHTELRELNPEERIKELSRMLGGIQITQKTMEHAREMLEKI